MRELARTAALVLSVALASACGGSRAESIDYARANAVPLVASTRVLWEKYGASAGEVPDAELPPVIRAMEPMRVTAGATGVMIYVYADYAHVTGVFVRHDPAFVPPGPTPPDSTDAGYEEIAPDVYWYSQPR